YDGRHLTPRVGVVLGQLRNVNWFPGIDAPSFNQHGGEVHSGFGLTISNPNPTSTIYYTTDGIDPRKRGGGISPSAKQYTGTPVTLNKTTLVKSRVLDGSIWSALNEAIFAVGPVVENLRISEIMYYPMNTGNLNDPNEEYIELTNIGSGALNLNLVQFTEGIRFTFPDVQLLPGSHTVVVKNRNAFEAQYGTSVNIAGEYEASGTSLANNGERIKLADAIGRTILDFKYNDGWYSMTDGEGFSLTMIDPTDSALGGPDAGLEAYWKFDDGSGNTATDSAGTNHGSLKGGTSWTSGRIGGALSFDGTGDYVSIAGVNALAGKNLTVQAWIRLDASAGQYNHILTQHDAGYYGYYFFVLNKTLKFYVYGSSGFIEAVSPQPLNTGQWYHVAGTNNGSQLSLYVDGQLKSGVPSFGYTGVNYNAYIGCEFSTPFYYYGLIDDVRVYDHALVEYDYRDIGDPMGRWSRKDSWRPSAYRNGTPGVDDSGVLPNPGAVVINEVMSHSYGLPDWIELHNTTSKPINIGGWFLSDSDRSDPCRMKYRIANGTTINGNDYKVFYQDTDFNNPGDPGCLAPFGLSENGERACLSSYQHTDGTLTGYRAVEDFGAAQTNVSFGRYYKSSTRNFNFVAMDYNTPDANNSGPVVGPIVINEIMYNPPSGNQDEEYIELYNIIGVPVTLYRFDKHAPWRFTDGIDYTFSPSSLVTIPAYGFLLVVKDKTDFLAAYGGIVPFGVEIVGSYSGRLSNNGEKVDLSIPGDIDKFGTRHYIRIDRVNYSDSKHPEDCPGGVDLWPPYADGYGQSLSRKDPNDYGNDVANWKGALPSPGAPNP
ncbi:MAG: lamin tail domain-containing protein, partial [Planctomycetota bacterium]